jgi:hypothetical protein
MRRWLAHPRRRTIGDEKGPAQEGTALFSMIARTSNADGTGEWTNSLRGMEECQRAAFSLDADYGDFGPLLRLGPTSKPPSILWANLRRTPRGLPSMRAPKRGPSRSGMHEGRRIAGDAPGLGRIAEELANLHGGSPRRAHLNRSHHSANLGKRRIPTPLALHIWMNPDSESDEPPPRGVRPCTGASHEMRRFFTECHAFPEPH